MNGTAQDWLDASSRTFMIGLAAFVWIVIMKLVAGKYGDWMPQPVRDLIAFA